MKNNTIKTNVATNQDSTQNQKQTLTFAQAKKKFVGQSIVILQGVCECRDFNTWDVYESDCFDRFDKCPCAAGHYVLELGVDDVHATRRAYHLECESVGVTFVVTKVGAAKFAFKESYPSQDVLDQIPGNWANSWSVKYTFCRAWNQKTAQHPEGRWCIFPCQRKNANCLAVASANWDTLSHPLPEVKGALAHKFVYGRFVGEPDYDRKAAGMQCALFRYDSESDKLVLK